MKSDNHSFSITRDNDDYWRLTSQQNPAYNFSIHPHRTEMTVPERILTTVGQTAVQRINEVSASQPTPDSLLGECQYNSIDLAENLAEEGFEPTVVSGSTQKESVKSLKDAYSKLCVHHWVEVKGYVVEICSEAPDSTGHIYVAQERPENYIPYRQTSLETLEKKASFTYPKMETVQEYISLTDPY